MPEAVDVGGIWTGHLGRGNRECAAPGLVFSSQTAHPAQQWQVCLAHQLRDCQHAIEAGDDLFAPRMRQLLLKAIVLQRRRHTLTPSTVQQYGSRFRGSLRESLNLKPKQPDGQRLLKRYQKRRDTLLSVCGHMRPAPNWLLVKIAC